MITHIYYDNENESTHLLWFYTILFCTVCEWVDEPPLLIWMNNYYVTVEEPFEPFQNENMNRLKAMFPCHMGGIQHHIALSCWSCYPLGPDNCEKRTGPNGINSVKFSLLFGVVALFQLVYLVGRKKKVEVGSLQSCEQKSQKKLCKSPLCGVVLLQRVLQWSIYICIDLILTAYPLFVSIIIIFHAWGEILTQQQFSPDNVLLFVCIAFIIALV